MGSNPSSDGLAPFMGPDLGLRTHNQKMTATGTFVELLG